MSATFLDSMRPVKHPFEPDPLNHGVTCAGCGEARDFGALHYDDSPEPFAWLTGPPRVSADPDADPLPRYGSTTDPRNCECGLYLVDAGGGWRTPGCPECRRR